MTSGMIKSIKRKFRSEGLGGLVRGAVHKIVPRRLRGYRKYLAYFEGRIGVEVGGPSLVFGRRGLFPAYQVAACIDNFNFHNETTWEGIITQGRTFFFDKNRPPGRQYIAEAGNLIERKSDSYDFVLSSHMLEHTANPLLALSEWMRVLKPRGALLLVVPHKEGTFDHRRPTTSLDHLVEDFERKTAEDDLTHLPEILEFHDLDLDPGVEGIEAFKARSEKNPENRCLHQHAFDTRLTVQAIDLTGFQIHAVEPIRPCHIVVIATKLDDGRKPDNRCFLLPDADYCKSSPFWSDRIPCTA